MTRFADDIAIVTGGTRGVGRAVSQHLADAGADVVAIYAHDTAAAAATERALAAADGTVTAKQVDVREFDIVSSAVTEIQDTLGAPSILVNNAGVMRNAVVARMSPADWQTVIDTNLTGTFNCTRAVVRPMLRSGGGRIVNVSSVAAQRGWAGQANYAASKAGILGFTRSIARELRDRSIRINAVCPGYVETDLYDEEQDLDAEAVEDHIPAGRTADPAEVADVVGFLLSDKASYISGEVLRIDGGLIG